MKLAESILRSRTRTSDPGGFIIEEVISRYLRDHLPEIKAYLEEEAKSYVESLIQRGLKGDKGDSVVGPRGVKGEQGEIGPMGPRGPQGERGKDGYTPRKGIDYFDGETPNTDEIISAVVTALQTKEEDKEEDDIAIPIENIAGLTERLRSFDEAIRSVGRKGGGSGGMGNPQHERFSTSSATTSIQTSFKIAALGTAIFGLRYNGQTLAYGRQYTVGSDQRTITFTFTLDDSSEVDVSYIRTS